MRRSMLVVMGVVLLVGATWAQEQAPQTESVATKPAQVASKLDPQAFRNAPGWDWLVRPRNLKKEGAAWDGQRRIEQDEIVIFDKLDDESIRAMVFARVVDVPVAERTEYRAVAFDADGERYYAGTSGASQNDTIVAHTFIFGRRVPAETIVHLGIEKLDANGRRQAMRRAMQDAENQGIQVLRLPQIDKPLPIDLATIDEQSAGPDELQGKVVVVDCWATWDSACMKLRPVLKRVHEKWHEQGLEIVSISFDNSQRALDEALEKLALPWPQVYVSREEGVRELWYQANGIRALPRLLLVDREGILRMELDPRDCEASIAAFMRVGDHKREPKDYKIEDLSWLAGPWEGTAFGEDAEEHWTAPSQGTMLGMFRLDSKTNRPVYEIMLIKQEKDGITLRLIHFARDLMRIDEEPLLLRLASVDRRKIVWQNAEQHGLRELTYERRDRDTVLITLERSKDGAPLTDKFFLHRAE